MGTLPAASLPAAAVATLVLAIAAPAQAARGSHGRRGGAPAPPAAQPVTPPSAEAQVSGIPTPVRTIAADGGSVELDTRSAGIVGHTLSFAGAAPAHDAGQVATLERLATTSGRWIPLARAKVRPNGAFVLYWKADVAGRLSVRAVVGPAAASAGAAEAAHSQSSGDAQVTIYHAGMATYFGPGLYGEGTACGQLLTPYVIGVANRTLPCGTLVAVSYGTQTLVVPVIDRGPYRRGVDWDLTYRAAILLGADGMEQVGTMVVGSTANTPLLGVVPGIGPGDPTGGSEAALSPSG